MTHVVIVGEGQAEETFTGDVLAPYLLEREITVEPRLIDTSQQGRGGALSRDRVIRALRNTLRERGGTYVTTFFDLYGLRHDFPGLEAARAIRDPLHKARTIEAALREVVLEASGGRADRFHPHIQPYEFEALLFTDVSMLQAVQPEWRRFEG